MPERYLLVYEILPYRKVPERYLLVYEILPCRKVPERYLLVYEILPCRKVPESDARSAAWTETPGDVDGWVGGGGGEGGTRPNATL